MATSSIEVAMDRACGVRQPPTAPGLTERQGQYLAFIDAYTRVSGRPPAEADLRRHFGVSAPSVHRMVVTVGTGRPDPAPVGGGAQHRGAGGPRMPPPSAATPNRQILCAEGLVESGLDENQQPIGIPSGPQARMILLYLQTQAVRTRCREVEL